MASQSDQIRDALKAAGLSLEKFEVRLLDSDDWRVNSIDDDFAALEQAMKVLQAAGFSVFFARSVTDPHVIVRHS